jgi:hypothetical protein
MRLALSGDLLRFGVDIWCVQETKINGDVDERIGAHRFLDLVGDSLHSLGFFHERLERIILESTSINCFDSEVSY